MPASASPPQTGLEVFDLGGFSSFAERPSRRRDLAAQMDGLQRIANVFVQDPEIILQELVHAAVALCGADSAGISIETPGGTDADFYHWVATAGQYSAFLNATLPRYPSACGICLDRQRPQHFRVGQPFFDLLGVVAPLVTDGILLPWQVDGTRGTIFIMAHDRDQAFDLEDCRLMQMLADFAAMGVRQHRQQQTLLVQARASAAVAMANHLAHRINNPLQGLTNTLYLAAQGHFGPDAQDLGVASSDDLARLSSLVKELLTLPIQPTA
jgi:hypothetical protein